jgi:uncharacterized OsmC-like protein
MTQLNGMNRDELRDFAAKATADPTVADRDPVVVARWLGGDESEVAFPSGQPIRVGGDQPSAMRLLLATLAACDVDLIATCATLLGIEIESLTVEASGHFNVSRYLGVATGTDPGYQNIAYTVRLRARGATAEDLARLREACEVASPVGDTLRRSVPLTMRFESV